MPEEMSRETLILKHRSLVISIAAEFCHNLPSGMDPDDLISCGMIGLIKAVDSYDPGKGVKLGAYARWRIRGQIIDEIRQSRPYPVWIQKRISKLILTYRRLVGELCRIPTDEELSSRLGITPPELDRLLQVIKPLGPGREWEPDRDDGVLTKSILLAIAETEDRQRQILYCYFFREMTLLEIGNEMGISEAWVCILKTNALAELKAKLGPNSTDPAISSCTQPRPDLK